MEQDNFQSEKSYYSLADLTKVSSRKDFGGLVEKYF